MHQYASFEPQNMLIASKYGTSRLTFVLGEECVLCEVGTGFFKFTSRMLIPCRLLHVYWRCGGIALLRNVGKHAPVDVASHPGSFQDHRCDKLRFLCSLLVYGLN